MELTPALDLRGGTPCWTESPPAASDMLPDRTDIAIVGAGVMGSMIGLALARAGHAVTVVDRRPPVTGSTAGSTALVMWAADTPLTHLATSIGEVSAFDAWRTLHRSVRNLAALIDEQNLECGWTSQPELYLSGDLLDAAGMEQEVELRQRAGLPSVLLTADAVHERFDVAPSAAALSSGTFGVDPIALTLELQRVGRAMGASFIYPSNVKAMTQGAGDVQLSLDNGAILTARHVVLATGYEAARLYLPDAFAIGSSFAIATQADAPQAWREDAMIWQASDPYLYSRRTADGRILVGGGDIEACDAATRDALLPARKGELEALSVRLLGIETLTAECAWSANFGSSPDGLPAIGRAANAERVWLAYGFGGNGITFAQLAAELLPGLIAGDPDQTARMFNPYRFN